MAAARQTGGTLIANYQTKRPMNIELSNVVVTPVLALLAGILILVASRIPNYFASMYLNVVGFEPPVRFEAAQSPAGTSA